MTEDAKRPVFIVGAPGSGTSLMRSMLNKHSRFGIATEMHLLTQWMDQFEHLDLEVAEEFDQFWRIYTAHKHFAWLGLEPAAAREAILTCRSGPLGFERVYRSLIQQYSENSGKPRGGEKTPANFRYLGLLRTWFPDAQFLFMIRDPRAIASSNIMTDEPWGQKDVHRVARDWYASVRVYEKWRHDPGLRLVQYERLVEAPEAELTDILDFLGESFEPSVLAAAEGTVDPNWTSIQLDPSGPISPENRSVWRHRLQPEQIAVVEHVTKRVAPQFGYEPIMGRLPRRARWRLLCERLEHDFRRAARAAGRPGRTTRKARLLLQRSSRRPEQRTTHG